MRRLIVILVKTLSFFKRGSRKKKKLVESKADEIYPLFWQTNTDLKNLYKN